MVVLGGRRHTSHETVTEIVLSVLRVPHIFPFELTAATAAAFFANACDQIHGRQKRKKVRCNSTLQFGGYKRSTMQDLGSAKARPVTVRVLPLLTTDF